MNRLDNIYYITHPISLVGNNWVFFSELQEVTSYEDWNLIIWKAIAEKYLGIAFSLHYYGHFI